MQVQDIQVGKTFMCRDQLYKVIHIVKVEGIPTVMYDLYTKNKRLLGHRNCEIDVFAETMETES